MWDNTAHTLYEYGNEERFAEEIASMPQPTLTTSRLVLRPFTLRDAPTVQELAGAQEVAATTLNIPHPYPDGAAEKWINTHQADFEQQQGVHFAITRQEDQVLCGAIGLSLQWEHARAEMGYWIGVPYWRQGYGTEAARAVVQYGFDVLGLNRICASHLLHNLASGRIMQKAGLMYEGCLRQHVSKWDVFHDLAYYGMVRGHWQSR